MIATARRDAGLSLAQLAERAGTSAATLHAYERGRVAPRLDTLQRVLNAAGASIELRMRPGFVEAERRWEFEQALLLAAAYPQHDRGDLAAPVFPGRKP